MAAGPGARRGAAAPTPTPCGRRARPRALRRHLQPLLRAREPARPRRGCSRRPDTACTGSAPKGGGRPLCCGRTYLSAGMVDEARREARRTLDALAPYVARGARGGRARAVLPPDASGTSSRRCCPRARSSRSPTASFLFEEVARGGSRRPARVTLPLQPIRAGGSRICTAIATRSPSARWGRSRAVLRAVPGLDVRPIESSCCGMAGAFGYGAETIDVSLRHGGAVAAARGRARRGRTTSSSPTGRAAATRSTTAPGGRRCMSRACSTRRSAGRARPASGAPNSRRSSRR